MEIRTWHFIVAMIAGWLRREQEVVIDTLREDSTVLREQLGIRPQQLGLMGSLLVVVDCGHGLELCTCGTYAASP